LDDCGFWDVRCHANNFTNTVVGGAATLWNGATNVGSTVVKTATDAWNDPNTRTIIISVAVIAVVAVATGGLGLALAPVLIGGLSGAGISGAFYAATCASHCSIAGAAAAVLSGAALGSLGGVAGPLAGAVSTQTLGLSGVGAVLATRGITGGISAGAQYGMDESQGKSTQQTAFDTFLAGGAGFLGAPGQVESPASFRYAAVDISENFRLSDTHLGIALGFFGSLADAWFGS
jgi:hypothetical protein